MEFRILQDVYAKLRLTPELKFTGSRTGFKQAQKEAVNIICNSAKFVELGLKIITYIHRKAADPGFKVNVQLQELYLCLFAILRYLQEDHATLLCESDFGSKTKKFYKSLLSSTSSYPARTLQKTGTGGAHGSDTIGGGKQPTPSPRRLLRVDRRSPQWL